MDDNLTTKRTGKVDDEEVDDELSDLERGEVLLPPDLVPSTRRAIIIVPAKFDGSDFALER